MTIRDLIDELESLAEEHGDGTEVRLAQQPRWAFEYSIGEIAVSTTDDDEEDFDDEAAARCAECQQQPCACPPVVYIGEGSQLGYLPGTASRALGWK